MKIRLSFVVPVVNPDSWLAGMISSLKNSIGYRADVELVVINQSDSSIDDLLKCLDCPSIEVRPGKIIPAAEARNFGASHANGEILFFMDDDALLLACPAKIDALLQEFDQGVNVCLCQRGELRDGSFITHWPTSPKAINERNFPMYAIEWNLIIRKSIFLQHKGFPLVGAGSRHAALSGEIFILMACLLQKEKIKLFSDVSVAHPSLIKKSNAALNLLGYFYGAGYAVGSGMQYFSKLGRLYWFARVVLAGCFDLVVRSKRYKSTTDSHVKILGLKLLYVRIRGLHDGFSSGSIKDQIWLSKLV
ncbi:MULTISPECIES: glycosyltransferase family 2 protein [Chromobacterium]|uniref:glycosyltransferase family 2 protein n=1 Tax=Chromobacterium TaxID=535 RepID=UPI001886F6F9|nr:MULTISPECIES: glycosyltransferase family A protein [Chromobacterium]QOZ82757.1 glycosyltransferase [Chromobacterium sp. Rain0013]WON82825.1 glycosyltransferase [Chromobacterium haemolyticum]